MLITPGTAVTGTITSADGDLWQLELAAASQVTITLAADESDLDTYLALYDSQYQPVAEHDDIELGVLQDSVLNGILLTEPGRYWIEARRCCPEDDQGSTGVYRLLVTVVSVE